MAVIGWRAYPGALEFEWQLAAIGITRLPVQGERLHLPEELEIAFVIIASSVASIACDAAVVRV